MELKVYATNGTIYAFIIELKILFGDLQRAQ